MSYEDANFQLSQIIRTMSMLGQDYSGVLKSWDSQKGTFDGYVPGQFKLPTEQERRKAAGMDDFGLLPGVTKPNYVPEQFTMGYAKAPTASTPTASTPMPPRSINQSYGQVTPQSTGQVTSQSGYDRQGFGMIDFLKDYGYGK